MAGWAAGSAVSLLISYACSRAADSSRALNSSLDQVDASSIEEILHKLQGGKDKLIYAKCQGTTFVQPGEKLTSRAPANREAAILVTRAWTVYQKYVETRTKDSKGNEIRESKMVEVEDAMPTQTKGDRLFVKSASEASVQVDRSQIPDLDDMLVSVSNQFEPQITDVSGISSILNQPKVLGHRFKESVVPIGERCTLLGNFKMNQYNEIEYQKSSARPSVVVLGSENDLRASEESSAASWSVASYGFGFTGAALAAVSIVKFFVKPSGGK
jgi:hypothetical protein